jgi:hypothetical protein
MLLRGSDASLDTNASADSDGFQLVRNKKKDKRERQRHRVVIGQSRVENCKIKGAPEPDRDLFIFRLDKGTNCAALETHVKDQGFTVREIKCVSHDDSKFKSFKLTVPKSQFAKLFDDSIWPSGVGVRKYIPPPKEDKQKVTDS